MEPSGVIRSLALIAVAVAGCQTPLASTSPSTAPTSAGATVPATTAPATNSPATEPGGLFKVVGSAPVIQRSMFIDRGAVLPGAIIAAADGTNHAWVIAFGQYPGTQEVHHLTSPDAVTWTEAADASLLSLADGFGNPGAIPTSILETDDGWIMYFVATLATESRGWDIWRATAPGPNGPWTRGDDPVLRRGEAGAWDAGGLDFPTVIPTEAGYTMLYSAIPSLESSVGSVGLATSPDGIEWMKHGDPVAEPGLCGGFDERAVHQPRVVVGDNGWYMVYAGYAGSEQSRPGVGLATSLDEGLTWGCQWPADALDPTGITPGTGIHTVAAFDRGGRLALLIEWLVNDGTDVWLAHLGPREP